MWSNGLSNTSEICYKPVIKRHEHAADRIP